MPKEGVLFDRVTVFGPAARHRAVGMAMSKDFNIHRLGGQRICKGLGLVWAEAANFCLGVLEAEVAPAELLEVAVLQERMGDAVERARTVAASYAEDPDEVERREAAGTGSALTGKQIQDRFASAVKDEIIGQLVTFLHGKLENKIVN
ncbi:unnamed protein product [Amoebophrya sp. A120]|nr:unnamed protein product [Amoebophrya sp. A120]|eukprot:GSA120T00000081001.1